VTARLRIGRTVAAAAVLLAAPLRAQETAPLAVPGDWEVGTPSSQGLDAAALDSISRRAEAGEFGLVHSLLVVRGGRLVYERYFRGWDMWQMHTVQSVSKSVTSALIGIAIGEGLIKGVSQPVAEFFPEHRALFEKDPRKRSLTLEHVLTMTLGNDWNERAHPYSSPRNIVWQMAMAEDWMGFVLGRSMVKDPGGPFNYNSGSSLLLSGILQNTTGMQAHVYAEKKLFDPLGIPVYGWYRNLVHPKHWSHTGGGVNLRARDMAKIGFLYVNRGQWQGKQVLPAAWVEQSVKPRVQVDSTLWYGYQWWLQPLTVTGEATGSPGDVIEGRGWGGQYIVAVPSRDLVVAVNSGSYEDQKVERLALAMALRHVVPLAKGGAPARATR
jgi:CubicO group peptidase (beta-lactamase class C family)